MPKFTPSILIAPIALVLAVIMYQSVGSKTSNSETNPSWRLIPSSREGDKGKYYLLETSNDGNIIKATSKRVGISGDSYSKVEIDCSSMLMREMGTSFDSLSNMRMNPTKWFELVEGSSKSDLANFLCQQ